MLRHRRFAPSHTHTCAPQITHTNTHAHTHTHAHTRTHTHTHTHIKEVGPKSHTRRHKHTRTHAHTHAHTHAACYRDGDRISEATFSHRLRPIFFFSRALSLSLTRFLSLALSLALSFSGTLALAVSFSHSLALCLQTIRLNEHCEEAMRELNKYRSPTVSSRACAHMW